MRRGEDGVGRGVIGKDDKGGVKTGETGVKGLRRGKDR